MKSDTILISKDVKMTFRMTARAIYVSGSGEVTIVLEQTGPQEPLPEISADYLDALCSRFYYGGYTHQDAIADILLLNGVLSQKDYDGFYAALRENLSAGRITLMSLEPIR